MISIDRFKIKLDISSNDVSQDDLLNILLEDASKAICLYLNCSTVPIMLEWIVEDLAVKKYRKLGSEGLSSESIDVINSTFESDMLIEYYPLLNKYSKNNGKVRLL